MGENRTAPTPRRPVRWLAFMLGLVGLLGCLAAVFGLWSVKARLDQSTENIFGTVDDSLIAVRDRVEHARERVEALRITSQDVEAALKDWTKREASERISTRLNVEDKAEQLASGIQQADSWLEFSESSIQLVKQAWELGSSAGAPIETAGVDELLGEIASLRGRLGEAIESVEGIRERAAQEDAGSSLQEKIDQAVRLALRLIATLGSIDSSLGELGARLSESRANAQDLKAKTMRWTRNAAIGLSLLLLWMATGQFALWRYGWIGIIRVRSV